MKVLIAGNGVSGKAAKEFLESKGFSVAFVKDEDLKSDKNLKNEKYVDRLFKGLSFIVTSPGIMKNNPLFKRAKQKKVKVTSEFELGANVLLGDTIAVTGTNGKTTTVTLINFLLRKYNANVFLGGNIGVPVTSFASQTQKIDISILECSSFQLSWSEKFKPHVAVILNLDEDHLLWHKSMKNYIASKLKIAKNQTENDYLILNADDGLLMKQTIKTKAQIFYFSTKKKVVGCYLKGKSIYFNDNLHEKKIASISGLRLVGEHNKSNVLAATLAVYLQTKNEKYLDSISEFEGVEHRIEYVKTIGGVSFVNDSKATNISSTIASINSFKENINLILGGSDKGYDFDELFAKIRKNVKNIIIFGQTKQKIAKSAKKFQFKNIHICDTLRASVIKAKSLSQTGYVVLLSPACASFDQFENYEQRGMFFKKIVSEIALYENDFSWGQEAK